MTSSQALHSPTFSLGTYVYTVAIPPTSAVFQNSPSELKRHSGKICLLLNLTWRLLSAAAGAVCSAVSVDSPRLIEEVKTIAV